MSNNTIAYFFISVIILLSFFLFSSVYYPALNSDDALSILILHDYHLPHDIYFWGQDRYGTIVPLLGQLFFKGFGMSSLWAESLAHYLILVLGFFAFSSFLKSNFNKVIFAIIWFCPILYFFALVRFYSGLQYSIIAIIFYLIKNYSSFTKDKLLNKLFFLSFIFILSIVAVWISDLASITLLITFFIIGLYLYFSKGLKKYYLEFVFTIISSFIGIYIIYLFKKSAPLPKNYSFNSQLFNSFQEIGASFQIIKTRLLDILLFNDPDLFVSIYGWLAILILCSLFFFKRSLLLKKEQKKWLNILLLDGFALFLIIIISHWAFLNGVARRYFTGIYIVSWLSFLIYIDLIPVSTKKTLLKVGIFCTAVLGILASVYNFKYIHPKRLSSKASVVKEFEQLGEIGIIAEYWNSYGTSFVNPDFIKATPHDKTEVRNYALVDSVFAQPRLFIIKDMWLDEFPDTLNQFGRTLIKVDSSFNIGNCEVNEYKTITVVNKH
jgi:hypothetical protein